MSQWFFSKIDSCIDFKFNQSMTSFNSYGVAGLIRENLQNSLDAKLNDELVTTININLLEVGVENLLGIEEIKKRILTLEGKSEYTKKIISNMKAKIDEKTCKVLTFEDLNTKGLSGALEKESPYRAYAYSKGYHAQSGVSEDTRGGSHGIGKIASNSASDIALMYFSTCDENNKKYIGGSIELIHHEFNNDSYVGTGHFASFDKEKKIYIPYENDYKNIYEKNERGLKIIVPFLREDFFDSKEIIRSICDSFYLSIINGQVKINIDGQSIEKETIEDYIFSDEFYTIEYKNINRNTSLTPIYYKTLLENEIDELIVCDMDFNEYKFKVYFSLQEGLKIGRYSVYRTLGMKISEKRIDSYASSSFNLILIANSSKEDKFLKTLENESHTKLSEDHISDSLSKKNAKRFLNNLDREITKFIGEKMKEMHPNEGKMDTSDILFDIENKFRNEDKSINSSVKILEDLGNNQEIDLKKEIVNEIKEGNNFDENIEVIELEEYINGNGGSKKGEKEKKELKKLITKEKGEKRRVEKLENNKKRVYSKISSRLARRCIIGNVEKLQIDLRDLEEINRKKVCDVRISVIDGEGKELNNFDLKENYGIIQDNLRNNLQISTDRKKIEAVPIKNGLINISMGLTNKFNKNLKFSYEVIV